MSCAKWSIKLWRLYDKKRVEQFQTSEVKEAGLVAADDGSRTNRDGAKGGWEGDTLMPYMSVRACVLLFMYDAFSHTSSICFVFQS